MTPEPSGGLRARLRGEGTRKENPDSVIVLRVLSMQSQAVCRYRGSLGSWALRNAVGEMRLAKERLLDGRDSENLRRVVQGTTMAAKHSLHQEDRQNFDLIAER
jgi:hypothetical protein